VRDASQPRPLPICGTMVIHVLFIKTLSSFSRLGMALLLRPSGLSERLPLVTALEYSLISLYSGFLYHLSHEGNRMVASIDVD
jgi:hypothetical protein